MPQTQFPLLVPARQEGLVTNRHPWWPLVVCRNAAPPTEPRPEQVSSLGPGRRTEIAPAFTRFDPQIRYWDYSSKTKQEMSIDC